MTRTAGHVRRREDPANPRSQLAVLTDEGARLMEQAAPNHVGAVRRTVFDALPPEQIRQFAEIGEAVNAALQGAVRVISRLLPPARTLARPRAEGHGQHPTTRETP